MAKMKVLHCITVYNGRKFVPQAIESAMRMSRATHVADVDVLVLDDASPEPGWSAELEVICNRLGANYYCTPRNLGIPRNVNLGLLTALEFGYDFVTINNSDVIFPRNLVNNLLPVASQPGVGSATAWSNNVSVYSIPNRDPDKYLSDQDCVDRINDVLAAEFTHDAVDIPAGISFCIMIPCEVLRDVGVMDPCFGRGYCEETDWSLRSLAAGYRICLAPAVFVYHQGRGSNYDAGLVSPGATTVPANEAIIDMRYPQFRSQVEHFMASRKMEALFSKATEAIIRDSISRDGYDVHLGWLDSESDRDAGMVNLRSYGNGLSAEIESLGFQMKVDLPHAKEPLAALKELLGQGPRQVRVTDRGIVPKDFLDNLASAADKCSPYRYPSRV